MNYFENQKKIFRNNKISLDTEYPNKINVSTCKMDLVFWADIEKKGPTPRLL